MSLHVKEEQGMAAEKDEHAGGGPTQAQIAKLKPTVYLCAECAKERGLSFDEIAMGRRGTDAPPAAP
jgi:sulfur relay (sulfurtransferase) complex TusBCD TusD component (DsrE family)